MAWLLPVLILSNLLGVEAPEEVRRVLNRKLRCPRGGCIPSRPAFPGRPVLFGRYMSPFGKKFSSASEKKPATSSIRALRAGASACLQQNAGMQDDSGRRAMVLPDLNHGSIVCTTNLFAWNTGFPA
jgi:hypothetical protein